MEWSLEVLYKGFDDPKYKEDLKKIEALIETIQQWTVENANQTGNLKEKIETFLAQEQELAILTEKLGHYAELVSSVTVSSNEAARAQAVLEDKLNELAATSTTRCKWISEITDLDAIIDQSPTLQAHAFFLKEIVAARTHMLSEAEEAILAKMTTTGSTAWTNYKNLLIANHKVVIEEAGKVESLPLTVVLNRAMDADKNVRKRAYEAELKSYAQIEEGVASALNAIKGEAITVAKMRNYASPLEMTLHDARMKKETLDAMLEAMRESFPHFRAYFKKKAALLGYNNGLPFYELYAPVIKKEMAFDFEQGKAFVEKNFRAFSPHLADYAKRAFNEQWIDIFPREGKVGGAFCDNLFSVGESRVMLNYGGSLSDVITLAHELGHGFHGECLMEESILNTDYPMPLAETASTFCETIVKKAALKEADQEEAFAILEAELSDCAQVIVDIYSRYLFETAVFEERKDGPLSVARIKELMLWAQKEAYGDGLDPDYLHAYMWTWKPHYYYADANFYNFPYAFGLLFAKGLYAIYEEKGESFLADYEKLLSFTGKETIEEVTKVIGVDIENKAFWQASLRLIEKDIAAFLKISDHL